MGEAGLNGAPGGGATLRAEFDRQIENLLQKGYPEAAGIDRGTFLRHIVPLRERAEELAVSEADLERGRLPFVIVIRSALVAAESAIERVERAGKHGFDKMFPREPRDFEPIEDVCIPERMAYLLVDIDRGRETINVTPSEALRVIREQGRSPLTIDEGVAIVTHYPEFLKRNNCYSLLASRHSGDRRVPAIWLTADNRPRLGWCWDGNPHTWLGSASCARRVGP
jgi:hypothetical protein